MRCLADKDIEVKREALLALVRKGDPVGSETAAQWLLSTERGKDDVRDISIRCVRVSNLRTHTPRIRELLSDDNEVVRIAAIVTLSEWHDEASRPAFEQAAASSVIRLERAGKAALARLDAAKKTVAH